MSTFRLAHLSDPHLPPPPLALRLRDAASKRALSRLAWLRKQHHHRNAVLEAVTADVRASAPDHIALTGDLTNFATPEEFEAAGAWLARLAEPLDLTVSPGNHDALVAHRAPEAFGPWRSWLGDPGRAAFPFTRVRGPVALVNLCSAIPTAPHLAQGALGADQLRRAEAVLREGGEDGLYRIVLVHHPITARTVSRRKALIDAGELRAVLCKVGAELILHGHAHEATFASTPGPRGPIPVMGVPSASQPPGRWHGFEITRYAQGFRTRIVARCVGRDGSAEDLGAFQLAV